MTIVIKPSMENLWGSEGGIGNPTLEQILSGWKQNQFPPSEIANFLQNKVETAIRYLYQTGISEWTDTEDYKKNSLVLDANKIYLSKGANKNKRPSLSPTEWSIAFDSFGANDDLRVEVSKILRDDGYLPQYVKRSDPDMQSKAKAPSFEADVGATQGFKFKAYNSGMTSLGGDLVFISGGAVNGRIKNTPPTLDMNDDTLVTTALLKKVIEEIQVKVQLPVGWSVITNNKKPPSDPAQLGYGTWVLDVQGRALVGVSNGTAENVPSWVRDPDSEYGGYVKAINVNNLPSFKAPLLLQTWVNGDDAAGSGAILTAGRNYTNGTQYPVNSTAEFKGANEPMEVVQPSQTKYIWTRTA